MANRIGSWFQPKTEADICRMTRYSEVGPQLGLEARPDSRCRSLPMRWRTCTAAPRSSAQGVIRGSSADRQLSLRLAPCPSSTFRKARLNEPANAGDASRATIWQGNCHVEDQLFYSNVTRAQNTIPIQYPISNCPAKPTGSFKRLYRKRARGLCSRTFIRGCASDKALTFFVPDP